MVLPVPAEKALAPPRPTQGYGCVVPRGRQCGSRSGRIESPACNSKGDGRTGVKRSVRCVANAWVCLVAPPRVRRARRARRLCCIKRLKGNQEPHSAHHMLIRPHRWGSLTGFTPALPHFLPARGPDTSRPPHTRRPRPSLGLFPAPWPPRCRAPPPRLSVRRCGQGVICRAPARRSSSRIPPSFLAPPRVVLSRP